MPADGLETPHSNQAGVQKQATHCEFVSSTRSALLPFGASLFFVSALLFTARFARSPSPLDTSLWTFLFRLARIFVWMARTRFEDHARRPGQGLRFDSDQSDQRTTEPGVAVYELLPLAGFSDEPFL